VTTTAACVVEAETYLGMRFVAVAVVGTLIVNASVPVPELPLVPVVPPLGVTEVL
jgi:hypothetical protein